MHNFQNFIKSVRESKKINISTVISATNLPKDIIEKIENASNDILLMDSSNILKTQIRRYCEYLDINEKDIVSILNKIDILYYKKSNIGKLKTFDYVNRLCIFILVTIITIFIINLLKDSVIELKSNKVNSDESSIIYIPIDYTVDNDVDNDSNKTIDGTDETIKKDKVIAHPPSQANMSTFVIEDNIPTEINLDNTNSKIDVNTANTTDVTNDNTQELKQIAEIDNNTKINDSIITDTQKPETVEEKIDTKSISSDKPKIVEEDVAIDKVNSTLPAIDTESDTTNKSFEVKSEDIQNKATNETNTTPKESKKSFWDIF